MIVDRHTEEVRTYKFGAIEFKVKGLGVFFPSAKLIDRIKAMPADELRDANKAAWKLRRTSDRLSERYSNVTLHGCGPHDSASADGSVAKAICTATWRALQS